MEIIIYKRRGDLAIRNDLKSKSIEFKSVC